MTAYHRPLVQFGPSRPAEALTLAGGDGWFTHVERLERGRAPEVVPVSDLPADARDALTAPRAPLAGLDMGRMQLMGILNVTPDSFSDGGQFLAKSAAEAHALAMVKAGAAMLDIGGESTRPGADFVEIGDEITRTAPVIAALKNVVQVPVSIDTRKADVARAALGAGAVFINDVSAFEFDPGMAALAAEQGAAICLMHGRGDPKTMQQRTDYEDVVLDVYDYLAARIAVAEAAGIPRAKICVDPGIGFGKTVAQNLALLARLSLFHGLGCPVLLGASRKTFIGAVAGVEDPAQRVPGSLGVALAGAAQGVQICRVHDIAETEQALRLWRAAMLGGDR